MALRWKIQIGASHGAASTPWPATSEKMYEYACHEGNYSLGGILRGARLLEREALAQDSAEERAREYY